MARPPRRRSPLVAGPRRSVPACRPGAPRGALGLRLHRPVAPRVRAVHGVPDGRHVRLHVHQYQPRPRQEPLRFVGLENYETLLGDQQAGLTAGHLEVRASSRCRSRSPAAPRRADAQQSRHLRGSAVPRPVLPAVRDPVRRRGPHLAATCSTPTRLGQRLLRLIGVGQPPEWLLDPTWIYAGLVLDRDLGIGAGIIVYLAGSGRSPPSSTTQRGSTARAPGRRSAGSPSR